MRLPLWRPVPPRAARRADQEHNRAKAPVAHVQAGPEVTLKCRAVEEAEVGVKVDEVEVDELGHQVWRREVLVPEWGNEAGGHGAHGEHVLSEAAVNHRVLLFSQWNWGGARTDAYGAETPFELGERPFVLDVRGGAAVLALQVDDGADELEVARLAHVALEADVRQGDTLFVVALVDLFRRVGRGVDPSRVYDLER